MRLYQNSSTLQISHRVPRNLGKTPSKKRKITRSSFKQIRIKKYITPLDSCYSQYKPGISCTHHEKFVQSSRMSNILVCVRVLLAISQTYRVFEIYRQLMRSTWKIETMVLPEPSRTMAYTPRKTVYRLAREQLHLNKARL